MHRRVRNGLVCLVVGSALLGLGADVVAAEAAGSPSVPRSAAEFTIDALTDGAITIVGGDQSVVNAVGSRATARVDLTPKAAPTAPGDPVTPSGDGKDFYAVANLGSRGAAAIVDTLTLNDGFMSAGTAEYVDLSWRTARAGQVFTIRRNNHVIGRTSETSFRDLGVTPGADYNYVVSADAVVDPVKNDAESGPAVFGFHVYTPASDTDADRQKLLKKINWDNPANQGTGAAVQG